jgi:C4-type Zn-finger protein
MVAAGAKTKGDYEKVVVTPNPDDVKGLVRIGDVAASAKKVFGDQTALREAATVKIKKAAAKKGATIVLIQVDNFGMSPINNVSMSGVAYASASKAADANQEAGDSSAEAKKEVSATVKTETEWEKVVVTRNNDDVKGLSRVDDVMASAKKVFGDQTALREAATISLKKAAAKKGASVVLVQVDNFAMTPINNVSLVGVAYK